MIRENANPSSAIGKCRSAVDQIDDEIVALLNERFEISRELATIKQELDVPIMDHERELSILERVSTMSLKSPDRANIVTVFRQILQESRTVQLHAQQCRKIRNPADDQTCRRIDKVEQ